jgi:pimeloyl-ACP methyl ester carboxylesterase
MLLWLQGAAIVQATEGPPLSEPESALAAAAWCDPSVFPGSGRQAVLLIHGTGSTPDEAWGWGYQQALPKDGFGVCTVTLPDRSVGSFTVSAEYAVYAARYAYQRSGRKIAIVGHSQGSFIAVWIAKFWPDVARNATDVISLSGPLQGTDLANTICVAGSCTPLTWQLRLGSQHSRALVNAPLQRGAAITSIGSLFDEIVFPEPLASSLPGASNIMLQDICPTRATEHGLMLADAVGYALVIDALRHDGGASTWRIPWTVCLQSTMHDADMAGAAKFLPTIEALALGLTDVTMFVPSEPPLPPYAAPYGDP